MDMKKSKTEKNNDLLSPLSTENSRIEALENTGRNLIELPKIGLVSMQII